MELVVSENIIDRIDQGDIVEIDQLYFLVCPHIEWGKYYLPSLNGVAVYGKEGFTLEEIANLVIEQGGRHYSKELYKLNLEKCAKNKTTLS